MLVRPALGKVRKLLRALVMAEEFARDHLSEAHEIVARSSGVEAGILRQTLADATLGVTLDQSLLLALEDGTRWAIRRGLTSATAVPDYRAFVYVEGLESVRPEAVRLVK